MPPPALVGRRALLDAFDVTLARAQVGATPSHGGRRRHWAITSSANTGVRPAGHV
jgi:hypothetical protein